MRWVEGTDLRSLIVSEARLDPGRVVAIVEQVGEALDAAHSGGLVHRDVKPANVMLTATHGREHAYLTDFGLTKKTEATKALTRTGHFVGTPDYMSPEQITGAPADARADVYALGCLMYHALTGRPPYDRDSEVATMYAHLNDPPPSAVETTPGTPVALDAVIARALAKEAARRYPSAGDLGRASRAAIGGPDPSQPERSLATGPAAPQVTEITPPPPPPPATPPEAPPGERPRRRALPLALAALVGLAAVGGLLAASGVLSGDGESSSEDNGSPAAGESPAETTPKAVATIPAGNGPDGIAVDGNTVWVSNSVGDTLTRLDTKTNKQIGEPVPVGRNPDGVAVADGAVWVANTDDGTVNRVAAGAEPGVTATVPVESGPESLSIGGALLWVANGNSDSVSRIDRASATSAGSPVGVGNKPIGLFAGEENVWVTNSFSGTVSSHRPLVGRGHRRARARGEEHPQRDRGARLRVGLERRRGHGHPARPELRGGGRRADHRRGPPEGDGGGGRLHLGGQRGQQLRQPHRPEGRPGGRPADRGGHAPGGNRGRSRLPVGQQQRERHGHPHKSLMRECPASYSRIARLTCTSLGPEPGFEHRTRTKVTGDARVTAPPPHPAIPAPPDPARRPRGADCL